MNIYFTTIKGRRESNEDRHNIILNINELNKTINNINLLGIYDGHGGTFVSSFLEKNIPIFYTHPKIQTPISKPVHDKIFNILQKKILTYEQGQICGSTCLINIIFKIKNEYYMNIVNLGDSRMIIIYKDGSFKQITTDHKPDDKIEKKRIKQMGGLIYSDSEGVMRIGDLSLSRAFGDGDNAPYISHIPDVHNEKITPDIKYIIMACDGLWDVVNNGEINKILDICVEKNSKNLASDLAKYALKKGSTDNISIIIIQN